MAVILSAHQLLSGLARLIRSGLSYRETDKMKLMKPVLLVSVVAAAGALAFVSAGPAHGQGRDRDWTRQLMILEGPGSRIGVTARELEPAELERLNIAGGVFLETVTPDSPAAKAGLRAQDIVVEFDGERVRSLRQFTRL